MHILSQRPFKPTITCNWTAIDFDVLFISISIIVLVCFPSVNLNSPWAIFSISSHFSSLSVSSFYIPSLHVPRSSFHFLLILVLPFFSIRLSIILPPFPRPPYFSSCSSSHFFPLSSQSSSLSSSSPLFLSIFVFCLVCFLKCPQTPSPSFSLPFLLASLPRRLFLPFSSPPLPPFHHVRPLISPVSCLLKHQRSQRAVEPPADSTHNSPLLIMRTTGARGAEFKHWKQQLKEVYESVLVKRWKRDCGVWCCSQLSVFFFWCEAFKISLMMILTQRLLFCLCFCCSVWSELHWTFCLLEPHMPNCDQHITKTDTSALI